MAFDGSDVDLAALKGNVVRVDFSAESHGIPDPLEFFLRFLGHFAQRQRGI